MKALEHISHWPKNAVIGMSLALVAVISLIRLLTGHELALSFLYLFPVCLSAWGAGRIPGILIAVLSAVAWLFADLTMLARFSKPYIPYINEFFRLLMFLFMGHITASMREMAEFQKKTARTDFLTGIPNRMSFIEYADIEINKSRRNNRPISMIYLDVDNFKHVNDTWGHHEGDLLLINVAATLTNSIRTTDFAARFGGDEFGILLWRSEAEDALLVAEKIKEQLLALAARKRWPVTFSLGLVTYETVPENVEELIVEADRLMYQAKQSGKNALKHRTVALKDVDTGGTAGNVRPLSSISRKK
jgi:diguanylate cyclase (GGDEF)-like protein